MFNLREVPLKALYQSLSAFSSDSLKTGSTIKDFPIASTSDNLVNSATLAFQPFMRPSTSAENMGVVAVSIKLTISCATLKSQSVARIQGRS